MPDIISPVYMHAQPPVGAIKGTKQLVTPTMHQELYVAGISCALATSSGICTHHLGEVAMGRRRTCNLLLNA